MHSNALSTSPADVPTDGPVDDDIDDETFVTQRAGKIVQESPLYVPVVTDSDVSESLNQRSVFDTRNMLQSTLLLQKKKEMNNVQINLEKKRAEFSKRMEECREKQEELRVKQKQIRDRVTKFEKFLKENDAKRQRANLKAMSEKNFQEAEYQQLLQLQAQLQEKTAKIQRLISKRVTIKKLSVSQSLWQPEKYQIYEAYLQSVIDVLPPDYLDVNEPHVNDILMRHKTLLETNEDLKATVQQNQDEIESKQNALAAMIKASFSSKNDLILVYNSKLGTQQKHLDKLKQEVAYAEQRIAERDKTSKERSRMIGETKLAINNIFDRIACYNARPVTAASLAPSTGGASSAEYGVAAAIASAAAAAGAAKGGGTGLTVGWAMPPADDPLLQEGNLSAISLAEKLKFIQEKISDLQMISAKAEQSIAHERAERQRKHAALAAELAQK
ncbi:hypothetical protein HDU82_007841 [Entophlyctis luteolus]|nr:hypothetical protein HDU82_007841 [Entophlyctis luteolus]